MQNLNITFVGGGNMARSLASGLLGAGLSAGRLRVSDPDAAQRGRFESFGIETFDDNDRAVAGSDVIVMAVKPQLMGRVLGPLDVGAALVVSIAAGVPLSALAAWTSPETAIVRCMPNTPALLGAGMTGLFANPRVTPAQRQVAEDILGAAGRTLWVETEALLDAVTAVSGSGPAYFFYLMEAMIDAGEALGLSRNNATLLTLETALGAARMAQEGGAAPAELRTNVTSPGGTTERALTILDAAGTRDAIKQAVTGAALRAKELAEDLGQP